MFLGANQDSYSAGIGKAPGNTQKIAPRPTSRGATLAWDDISKSHHSHRVATGFKMAIATGFKMAASKTATCERYFSSRSAETEFTSIDLARWMGKTRLTRISNTPAPALQNSTSADDDDV